VFIDFTGSDWCYWCILADKNIFSTSEWEKFSRKMVCLKVDFPKNNRPDAATQLKRKAFAREFNVRGYPTFVLASPERKEIARFSAGRKSAAAFIAEVEKALPR
jgi:thiol:disulfide interchange protein